MLHLLLAAAIFPALALLLALPFCIAALLARGEEDAAPELAPRSRRPVRRVVRGAVTARRLRPSMHPRPMSSALAHS